MILLRLDRCVTVCVYVHTCVVEQVVKPLLQLWVYGRLSSWFPVDISSLALTVSAVFGALPIRAVLTSISAQNAQSSLVYDDSKLKFMMGSWDISRHVWGNKTRCIKQNVCTSPALFVASDTGHFWRKVRAFPAVFFNKMSEHLPLHLWQQKNGEGDHGTISSRAYSNKNLIFFMGGQNILCCVFEADTWSFPNPNLSGFVPKP